jgi:hypothetical protein
MTDRRIPKAKKRKELKVPPFAGGSKPQLEEAGWVGDA